MSFLVRSLDKRYIVPGPHEIFELSIQVAMLSNFSIEKELLQNKSSKKHKHKDKKKKSKKATRANTSAFVYLKVYLTCYENADVSS